MILVDRLIITLVPMAIVVMVEISIVEISQGVATTAIGHLAKGVKTVVTLVEIKEIEVEVGLTPAQPKKSRRFNRMDTDYNQDGQYSDYDDTDIYADDYDDEVFATLNS